MQSSVRGYSKYIPAAEASDEEGVGDEDDESRDEPWSWHSVSISSMSADTSVVARKNRNAVDTQ